MPLRLLCDTSGVGRPRILPRGKSGMQVTACGRPPAFLTQTTHIRGTRWMSVMRFGTAISTFSSAVWRGPMSERAPLFERFTLGDSRTLRGWNKFDVAPLGGTRTGYGSVQYMYRNIGGFYDAGAVWDKTVPARTHHSAGVLLALNDGEQGPFLAIGFPLRSGSVVPLLIIGMNF
jgi:hypothetical protein